MAMSGGTAKLVKTTYPNYGAATSYPIKLYVYYKTSQDVANNKSTISCGMYVTVTSGWYIGAWDDFTAESYVGTTSNTFDGSIPSNTSGTTWLAENKTFTVTHDADGTGSATIKWKWNINSPYGQMVYPSGSFTINLPTIPRASTVSCTTANIGSKPTITITSASSSFTHTLSYAFGDLSGTIVEKTTSTSYKSWTIPTTFYAEIPNAISGTGTITCKTYNGSTLIGTKTCSFKATVPESASKPTLNPTAVDSNSITIALTGDRNVFVKYYSNISVSSGAAARNSATLKSQKITCGSSSITTASGTIKAVTSGDVNFSATDSRGYTTTQTLSKTLINYIKLTCSFTAALSVDGVLSFTAKGNYFNGSFGASNNTLTVQYCYKISGGSYSDWTTFTATITDNTYTASGTVEGLDYQSKYTVRVRAIDALNTVTPSAKSVIAKPVFDFSADDFTFNVPVNIPKSQLYIDNNGKYGLDMNNSDIIGVNAIYGSDTATTPKEGINFYRDGSNWDSFWIYNGNVYFTPNYPSNTANRFMYYSTVPLYIQAGDVVTVGGTDSNSLPCAGHITGSTKNLFFFIPLSRPILASSVTISGTVTARGINGYVSGNTNLSLTSSDAYTVAATIQQNSGVQVRLLFTDTIANATNNTPVSVSPNGIVTLTFA